MSDSERSRSSHEYKAKCDKKSKKEDEKRAAAAKAALGGKKPQKHDDVKDDDIAGMFRLLREEMIDMKSSNKHGLEAIDKTMKDISKQLENHSEQLDKHSEQIDGLIDKFEKMCTRVTKIEDSGIPKAAGGARGTWFRNSSTPPIDRRLAAEAENPKTLRLKGFNCMYSRPDLILAAEEVVVALGFSKDDISKVHASGSAFSCVIEFATEKRADEVFQAGKATGTIKWSESSCSPHQLLKLTHDESRELARSGAALRILWDITFAKLQKHDSKQKFSLATVRHAGQLALVIGKRRYPLFKIENNGHTFSFGENKFRGSLPSWINEEIIEQIQTEATKHELFESV